MTLAAKWKAGRPQEAATIDAHVLELKRWLAARAQAEPGVAGEEHEGSARSAAPPAAQASKGGAAAALSASAAAGGGADKDQQCADESMLCPTSLCLVFGFIHYYRFTVTCQ